MSLVAELQTLQERQSPDSLSSTEILTMAQLRAASNESVVASVSPEEAWELAQRGDATIVDVRSIEELKSRGQVPGSRHAAWATGTALIRNPRFLKELESQVHKDETVLLLCAAGKRSHAAAVAAAKGGFGSVYSIEEGAEGSVSENLPGWRARSLPWQKV